MKLKSIIIDDEKHGRENLAGILREYCREVELLGEAASGLSRHLSALYHRNPCAGMPVITQLSSDFVIFLR